MATPADEERLRADIANKLETLRPLTPESLTRLELGDLSFREAEPILRRYWNLFEELRKVPLSTVPFNTLNTALAQIDQALNSLNTIRTFNPVQYAPNPVPTRDNLINALWNQWDNCWSLLTPLI